MPRRALTSVPGGNPGWRFTAGVQLAELDITFGGTILFFSKWFAKLSLVGYNVIRMRWWASWTPKNLGPMYGKWFFISLVFEICKFIFALGENAGKLTCVNFGFLSMSSICWLSLENEATVYPDMMKNISRENDEFRLENISSQDVPYAFRITQGAFWRPQEMFQMTFWHLKVGTFVAGNFLEIMMKMMF